jgi:hypothetical protein
MRGLNASGPRGSSAPGTRSCRTSACGHYEPAADVPARHPIHAAFDQLTMAI